VHQELASQLDETHAEPASEAQSLNLKEAEDFEEILAESVYEGLSWASSVVASIIEMYIQTASRNAPGSNVEIGMRKAKLSIQDCENLEKCLDKTFGFGAKVVECKILRILHSKLGVNKEIEADFSFLDEVRTARELHSSKPHAQDTQ
jgi:hypothetical protein